MMAPSNLWTIVRSATLLWIAGAAASLLYSGHTLGRYAHSYAQEYAVHCFKVHDVAAGRQRVEDCIARRLPESEQARIAAMTSESYFGGLGKFATALFAPPLLFIGGALVWRRLSSTSQPDLSKGS